MRPPCSPGVVHERRGSQIDGRGLVRIRTYVEKGSDFASWSQAMPPVKAIGRAHFPKWGRCDVGSAGAPIYAEENGKVVRRYDPALMKTLSGN